MKCINIDNMKLIEQMIIIFMAFVAPSVALGVTHSFAFAGIVFLMMLSSYVILLKRQ